MCGVTGASTYYTSSLANYEDVKQQLACQGYTIQVTAKPNVAEYMYRAEEDPERERDFTVCMLTKLPKPIGGTPEVRWGVFDNILH